MSMKAGGRYMCCVCYVEADVLVNLIGDEGAALDRASRVSAEFCAVVGPKLQAVSTSALDHDTFTPHICFPSRWFVI